MITPTGGRPECLDLCARFVARQTWAGPLQWVVVDDADPMTKFKEEEFRAHGIRIDKIRPSPRWQKGQNTLARNLLAALEEGVVRNGIVMFIEDDEYYAPDYVEGQVCQLGEDARMAGEAPARYYHVPTRQYRILDNRHHASLSQTCVRADVLPLLRSICERPGQTFIDVQLWGRSGGKRVLHDGRRSVGMKGLPGRPGIGVGHRPNGIGWWGDVNLLILENWIGKEDAEIYRSFK